MTINERDIDSTPVKLEAEVLPSTIEHLMDGFWSDLTLDRVYETDEGELYIHPSAELQEPLGDERRSRISAPYKHVTVVKLPAGLIIDLTDDRQKLRPELSKPDQIRTHLGEPADKAGIAVVGLIRNFREYYSVAEAAKQCRSNSHTYADLRRTIQPVGFSPAKPR
jgi:hypothetical protein